RRAMKERSQALPPALHLRTQKRLLFGQSERTRPGRRSKTDTSPGARRTALQSSKLFAGCEEIWRSAPVPGRSTESRTTGPETLETLESADIAAPGDGRTPVRMRLCSAAHRAPAD